MHKSMIVKSVLMLLALIGAPAAHAHGNEHHGAQPQPEVAQENTVKMDAPPAQPSSAEHGTRRPLAEPTGAKTSKGLVSMARKFHPATVHFPIALILMAALAELCLLTRPRDESLKAAIRIMTYGGGGGGGAIIAALFGWLHTGMWFGGDQVMALHRWIGSGLAIFGLAGAVVAHRRSPHRLLLRLCLCTLAIMVLIQGYLGGEIAHGPNHLGIFAGS